jgi:hypothetical protein
MFQKIMDVDFKEEAGRRSKDGAIGLSVPRDEDAAKALAGEATCMANTPKGGCLIVGVADNGDVIGTELEAEWLRARIYELTARQLTVDVKEATLRGHRVLIVDRDGRFDFSTPSHEVHAVRVELELLDGQRFDNDVMHLHHRVLR